MRSIYNLEHYGAKGKLNRWFENWITKCEQQVVVDGSDSESEHVLSGVPQGTVLSPLMFLIYINDIGERITWIQMQSHLLMIAYYIKNKNKNGWKYAASRCK